MGERIRQSWRLSGDVMASAVDRSGCAMAAPLMRIMIFASMLTMPKRIREAGGDG